MALANLFVDLFLEAHMRSPKQIVLDLDATDDPLSTASRSAASSTAIHKRRLVKCEANRSRAERYRPAPQAPSRRHLRPRG
jgi:hypothetical protein